MYKLIWHSEYGKETIEEDIKTIEEARYLRDEYTMAYKGYVQIAHY